LTHLGIKNKLFMPRPKHVYIIRWDQYIDSVFNYKKELGIYYKKWGNKFLSDKPICILKMGVGENGEVMDITSQYLKK
jgi:hypothetical protein